jgi:hypothetical protein
MTVKEWEQQGNDRGGGLCAGAGAGGAWLRETVEQRRLHERRL